MRATGATEHPFLARVLLAQKINLLTGSNVRPWEVDEIPWEWLTAIEVMAGAQQAETAQRKVGTYFDAAMRNHPTFRKH